MTARTTSAERNAPPPCAGSFTARRSAHPEKRGCLCTSGRCALSLPQPAAKRRLGSCGWVMPEVAERS